MFIGILKFFSNLKTGFKLPYSLTGGGSAEPGTEDYLRPGGVDTYRRPGGTDVYKRPA